MLRETGKIWVPLPGPQTDAYHCKADILFYGGAAGGGKTDLAIGLALTEQERSIIYRREATQLQGIYDRMAEIVGGRVGFNSQDKIWRLPHLGKQVEFGSCPNMGDETKYQGRPHDCKIFDEICHFLEAQVRFLMGWKRSANPSVRQRVVFLGNPPTDSDGEWVVKFFAPWLDPDHPNKAKPGELRWFVRFDGQENDTEVPSSAPVTDPKTGKQVQPLSRTFIPSKVQDNPYLMESGYEATLQSLPEPLRSQMLKGDFMAGRGDDPWQVLPTEWVRAAQARWKPRDSKGTMDSVGVDVARGGRDKTVISRRHGNWFDELVRFPGTLTPDGPTVAGQVLTVQRNGAVIHVDAIGVGSSVVDFLAQANVQVEPLVASESSHDTDKTGRLTFVNKRAEWWWKFREALDPSNDTGMALPPDDRLRSDLCAPRWLYRTNGIQIESKEDLAKRIGRSPDDGDAVIYAHQATMRRSDGDEFRDRVKKRRKGIV